MWDILYWIHHKPSCAGCDFRKSERKTNKNEERKELVENKYFLDRQLRIDEGCEAVSWENTSETTEGRTITASMSMASASTVWIMYLSS